jgi:hypothetical protein
MLHIRQSVGPKEDIMNILHATKNGWNEHYKSFISVIKKNNQVNDKNAISSNILFYAITYNDVNQWHLDRSPRPSVTHIPTVLCCLLYCQCDIVIASKKQYCKYWFKRTPAFS